MVAKAYDAGLKQTIAFIDQDPVDAVFERKAKSKSTAGGTLRGAESESGPQRVRLIPARTETTETPLRMSSNGRQVLPEWTITALPGADIALYDWTTIEGKRLEVLYINDKPSWRLLIEAKEHDDGAG